MISFLKINANKAEIKTFFESIDTEKKGSITL